VKAGRLTTRPINKASVAVWITCAALCTTLTGCYQRVVRDGRFMARFDERRGGSSLQNLARGNAERPEMPTIAELRTENPDGSVTLRAGSVRDLMLHIGRAVEQSEADIFFEQVLASPTRAEFRSRGLGAEEALGMLKESERDLRALFEKMPAGEFTPGLFLRQLGPNVFRLEARGVPRGVRYTFIDVVFEEGNFKLRWFGPG